MVRKSVQRVTVTTLTDDELVTVSGARMRAMMMVMEGPGYLASSQSNETGPVFQVAGLNFGQVLQAVGVLQSNLLGKF